MAMRGEKLELLVNKADNLATGVSIQLITRILTHLLKYIIKEKTAHLNK